jgi:hypothetical protein
VSEIITDSELIEKFAKKAMEEPEPVIQTRAPSGSEVFLPGGFIEQNGEIVKTAEVRELTGADEEAIAKAGSAGKALNVLLQRGLVRLGARDVRKEDFDLLLSGDRDAILIGIRRVTFGNDLTIAVQCPHCESEQTTDIDLSHDIPMVELKDPVYDRTWTIKTSKGEVNVALPTGVVQRKLMENADKTSAEINTLLLSGCVLSINGSPSAGASTALSLGMADRNKIIDEIINRNSGPRLGEVNKPCKACGEGMSLPLSLLDLFRF